jgi:glutathione reductase (NADPH)
MPQFDVDLMVIGAGSGGVRAARIASSHGAKVMIAEEYRTGGSCVIRGCVPKKHLVYASRFAHAFEDAHGFGWRVGDTSFDWSTLIAAKDKDIARLENAYTNTLDKAGVTLVKSRAVIEDAHTVRLLSDDRLIRARYILIATGAYPSMEPAITGGEYGITSNEVFHLAEQPKRIIVVGGGYIAVEFAGIFQGLGSKVTLIHRGEQLLRGFDMDVRVMLGEAYRGQGMDVRLNTTIERIEKTPSGLIAHLNDGKMIEVDQILVATGRKPNTAGLGLEKVGVALNADGAIAVSAGSQTSVPSIYAVGDVTNRANLTPVAIREGHAFADSVFGAAKGVKPWVVDHALIPTGVFSTPEIGTVGMSEEAARATFENIVIYKTTFRPMKATLSGRAEKVLMKIIVDGMTDKVLGVHIVGEDAGEMIQMVGIAVQMGATKADFDRTMAVHPTAAEELVTMRTPFGGA